MSDNISQTPRGSGIPEKSSGSKASDSESCKVEGLEEAPGNDAEFVDKATERAVVRKLDYRIIPMVMWVYLMNMMDRGAFFFSCFPYVGSTQTRVTHVRLFHSVMLS